MSQPQATDRPPAALIYVDGQEVRRCYDGDDYEALFKEAVAKRGGEVALCVYKARYGGYLRQRMSISASKQEPTR